MTIINRLRDLWVNEPAVLRGIINGVVGLVFLVAGGSLEEAEVVAGQIFEAFGILIIVGTGVVIRPKVSPVDRDQ